MFGSLVDRCKLHVASTLCHISTGAAPILRDFFQCGERTETEEDYRDRCAAQRLHPDGDSAKRADLRKPRCLGTGPRHDKHIERRNKARTQNRATWKRNRKEWLGGLNIFSVISVKPYLRLARFSGESRQRVDAIGLEQALQLTALPKSKSLCGKPSFLSDTYSPMESK